MGSRLKVMKLLLQDGTLEGLLTVEDSSWNNGTLLSCPRDNIESLLSQKEVNRYGVYLLLSEAKVYVGQSTQLKRKRQFHHPKPMKMPVRCHQTVIPGRLF